VKIQFAGVSVIAPDPATSRKLFVEALGLPLEAGEGDDYFHSGTHRRQQARRRLAPSVRPPRPASAVRTGPSPTPSRRRVWSSRSRTGPPCKQRPKSCAAKGFTLLHEAHEEPLGQPWPGCNRSTAR
jgi:hypothetical protein